MEFSQRSMVAALILLQILLPNIAITMALDPWCHETYIRLRACNSGVCFQLCHNKIRNNMNAMYAIILKHHECRGRFGKKVHCYCEFCNIKISTFPRDTSLWKPP